MSKMEVLRHAFRDFVLFIVFFPHLIAGPIVCHRQIVPQIARLGQNRDVALGLPCLNRACVGDVATMSDLFGR